MVVEVIPIQEAEKRREARDERLARFLRIYAPDLEHSLASAYDERGAQLYRLAARLEAAYRDGGIPAARGILRELEETVGRLVGARDDLRSFIRTEFPMSR